MKPAPRPSAVCLLILASFLVIGTVSPNAQQRPAGGAPLIVDFVAVGADGQPVPDLAPGDVTIRIAGKNRTISSLELKKAATGGASSALPAPYAVNTPSGGRSFLIIVDTESLRAGTEQGIRASLEELFKGLGSADRVAFSIAPRDTAQVGFGAGLPAVREALGKTTGMRPAGMSSADNTCRSRDSLVMLRSMIEALGAAETPTNVLYIASGLVLPTRATGGTGQSCEVTTDLYQSLAASAATSRVNLYVAQGDEAIAARDEGLSNLAGVTNAGEVLRVAQNGLARIATESSAYYVAAVQPDPSDRPGQPQRLEVRSSREGVTIRSRNEIAIGRGGPAARGGTTSPRDMLRTTAAFTDLQLRTSAYVSRGQGDKVIVFVLTEPVDPSTKLTALSAGLVDPAGKLSLQATADEKQIGARSVALFLPASPGKYRLRVAATDANGRSGAVDHDLTAELTSAGSLKLGGMLLVAPRGESYAPQLQFSEDEIGVSLEIYGQLTGQVSAKIEVAESVDGPAVVTADVGGQATSEPDKFILNAKVPIAKLKPGDYIVRAIVQMVGQPEGRVIRTLRKVAK